LRQWQVSRRLGNRAAAYRDQDKKKERKPQVRHTSSIRESPRSFQSNAGGEHQLAAKRWIAAGSLRDSSQGYEH
jgi:hypothetical protein